MSNNPFAPLLAVFNVLRRTALRHLRRPEANRADQSLTPPSSPGVPATTKAPTFRFELSGRHRRKLFHACHLSGLRH